MKAIVVFESMYGNTRHIAEAIADGLRWSMPTEAVLARDAAGMDLVDVELVVVGGPTHAWGLSSKRTREGAKAWDTFMTLAETATKLGVSFYHYIHDRVSGIYQIPALADTIEERAKILNLGASWNTS